MIVHSITITDHGPVCEYSVPVAPPTSMAMLSCFNEDHFSVSSIRISSNFDVFSLFGNFLEIFLFENDPKGYF